MCDNSYLFSRNFTSCFYFAIYTSSVNIQYCYARAPLLLKANHSWNDYFLNWWKRQISECLLILVKFIKMNCFPIKLLNEISLLKYCTVILAGQRSQVLLYFSLTKGQRWSITILVHYTFFFYSNHIITATNLQRERTFNYLELALTNGILICSPFAG